MTDPTTHNFGDGAGPVLAHRHANGGGWVADTATVEPTVFVGRDARVFGTACVFGTARVGARAYMETGRWDRGR